MLEGVTLAAVEWLAAGLAVGMVMLNARLHPAGWILNALSALLYLVVFASAGLWAQTGLQLVFAGLAVWGWRRWRDHAQPCGAVVPLALRTPSAWMMSGGAILLLTIVIWGLLQQLAWPVPPDRDAASEAVLALDAVQLGDAATTAGSLVATWMLARRWPENWLVWMVVNSGASALFLFQGLYPTAALYVLLTIMAAWGWWRWRCQADGAVKWAR